MYLVSEVNYEYNDEIYYAPESEGVTPLTLYTNLDKAKQVAFEKSLQFVLKDNRNYIPQFGYCLNEIIKPEAVNEILRRANLPELNCLDENDAREYFEEFLPLLEHASVELQKDLMSCFRLKLYNVKEVVVAE